MAYGSFVVRVAGSADKSKWKTEIHKTARAALKAARGYAHKPLPGHPHPQVCVFNMNKWGAKPVCIRHANTDWKTPSDPRYRPSAEYSKREYRRDTYTYAPSKIAPDRPGGPMRRLALDRDGNGIVKLDGFRRRKRRK